MPRRDRFPIDRLRAEFLLIDANLDETLDIYLIGGCAMGLAGLKAATKDIDVIVTTTEEFRRLENALMKADYVTPDNVEDAYNEMGINGVFDKPGTPRWDGSVGAPARPFQSSMT